MRKMWAEYKEFIQTGDVVMIAVGLVMALFIKDIIDAIVNGVIMPIVSAIVGEPDFTNIGFDLGDARISIGLVIRAVLIFLIVAAVLFLMVKAYNKYIAKPAEEIAPETELSLLAEIRDELRAGRGAGGVAPPTPPVPPTV